MASYNSVKDCSNFRQLVSLPLEINKLIQVCNKIKRDFCFLETCSFVRGTLLEKAWRDMAGYYFFKWNKNRSQHKIGHLIRE
jgi:hypothetical protein